MEALTEFVSLVNEKTGEFSTFLATAQKAGLVEARSGNKKLTVFAPADTTFADIDLLFINGVVQVVDKLLIPATE